MKPNRRGQVVKFHTPKQNENAEQLYVIIEYIENGIKSKAKIHNLKAKIVIIALAEDLIVDEKQTKMLERYLKVQGQSIYEQRN